MSKLPSTQTIQDGDIEVPSVGALYDFFAPRTKSIVVWSVGFRYGGLEATIAESTGAKIQIFDCTEFSKENYQIFERILTTHETQEGDLPWAEKLSNIWILPDSTTFHSYLPSSYTGTLQDKDLTIHLKEVTEERVDICKIDLGDYTPTYLYEFLNRGYRPGLLWVNWPAHPDESSMTMAAAGHLQNLGYRLLASINNYFVYIFVDECMYEICSWNTTTVSNPMFAEFQSQLFEQLGITPKKTEDSSK